MVTPDPVAAATAPDGPPPMTPDAPERFVSPGYGAAASVRLPRRDAYTRPDGQWEQLAAEVAAWIDATATAVAESLFDGNYAPFSARVTLERAAAFYADRLFFAGGLPNPQGWEQLYQTAGAQGLVDAVRAAEAWRREHGLPVVAPPPVVPGQPQGQGFQRPVGPAGLPVQPVQPFPVTGPPVPLPVPVALPPQGLGAPPLPGAPPAGGAPGQPFPFAGAAGVR